MYQFTLLHVIVTCSFACMVCLTQVSCNYMLNDEYSVVSNGKQIPIVLTHWGRVTHICVGNLAIIGPDNGLSPGRRQAIIWTSAGILLIGPWGTNFSENLIGIQTFSFKKMHLKMSSAKWRPVCLDLNVLSNDNSARETWQRLCNHWITDFDEIFRVIRKRSRNNILEDGVSDCRLGTEYY